MKTIKQSLLLFILFIGVAALVIPVLPADNNLQLSVVSAFGGGPGGDGAGGGDGGGGGCGGCGSGGDPGGEPEGGDPAPTPKCTAFNITQSVVEPGANLTFSWSTSDVTNASINGIGAVTPNGTNKVYQAPTTAGTYTYILTFDGKTNSVCKDTVKVVAPTPAPICTLDATADTIVRGESTILKWTTTNATKVTLTRPDFVQTLSLNGNVTVSPYNNYTFVLKATGPGGEVICKTPITVTIPPVVPKCHAFSITQSVVEPGANLTFSWSTSDVTNASINGIGAVTPNGTNKVYQAPTTAGTYTYILTFDGKTNSVCKDTVKVVPPTHVCEDPHANNTGEEGECTYDKPAPKCIDFTGSKTTIFAGESLILSWETENATRIVINNAVGNVTDIASKQKEVSPLADTIYQLTVIGEDGTVPDTTCKVPVIVKPKVEICEDPKANNTGEEGDCTYDEPVPMCKSFSIAESTVAPEANITLSWNTENVDTVSITSIGEVAVDGVNQVFKAPAAVGTYIYVLTYDGETNTTCQDTLKVEKPVDEPKLTCSDISISASDTTVREGSDVTLEWVSTGNVDSVSIDNGIGDVNVTDSRVVRVNDDIRYNFTIRGLDDTENCSIAINTTSGGGGGGGGSVSPRCELKISDDKVESGDRVTLSWESRNATELSITDDRGNTIVTTEDRLSRDKDDLFDGEVTVRPTRDTTYTLLVERGSRDRECKVDVEVEDDEIVLLQTRTQAPLVSGISLTQVPYTGFEAGPLMTVLFYALLVAWALYITYVLVIPKAMFSASPVLVTPRDTVSLMNSAEETRPDVFAPLPTKSVAASAIAPAPSNLPTTQVAVAPATATATEVAPIEVATQIENAAHAKQALLSSGAVQSLIAMTTEANRMQTLATIVNDAKGAYPLEDGWVVINQTRLSELTAQTVAVETATATTTVTGSGSLAEALVTGNVVAAYEMIGNRPMFALADAAADLDAVYRNRKGSTESVSNLLETETANLSDEQIANMIQALTGALDGTYTDEEAAVKMAIMKAVQVAAN